MPTPLTAAVMIATYNRPENLTICLDRLATQTVAPTKVIVVDSSTDDRSMGVAREHNAMYVRNPLGRGHTATSRMLGVALAEDVDVIAFIDDDAYAAADWLEQLLRRYDDDLVAGVGGRATNGEPGEETEGLDDIGTFRADGTLGGHFGADPGRDIRVDHLLGANMSLRTSTITELGGIRDYYPGTCLREESEIALRMRRAGYLLTYTPEAVVEHVAATYARGRRFDARYAFYAERNHLVLLARVVGTHDPRYRAYLRVALQHCVQEMTYAWRALGRGRAFGSGSITSGVGRGVTKAAACAAGIVVGLCLVGTGRIPYAGPPAGRLSRARQV